jgi:hypothetical protein
VTVNAIIRTINKTASESITTLGSYILYYIVSDALGSSRCDTVQSEFSANEIPLRYGTAWQLGIIRAVPLLRASIQNIYTWRVALL